MATGIVCAMNSELEKLKDMLQLTEVDEPSPWSVFTSPDGSVIALIGGVGKVSAAASLSYFLSKYPVDRVIGVGVAGGIAPDLRVGDVLICSEALQHDMDVTAFGYELGMIPGIRLTVFPADSHLVQTVTNASLGADLEVRVRQGRVLSGDKFVAGTEAGRLRTVFSGDCVDMETAAWAHVAHLWGVPWVAIRSISDQADGKAPENFLEFLEQAVSNLSNLIASVLPGISE